MDFLLMSFSHSTPSRSTTSANGRPAIRPTNCSASRPKCTTSSTPIRWAQAVIFDGRLGIGPSDQPTGWVTLVIGRNRRRSASGRRRPTPPNARRRNCPPPRPPTPPTPTRCTTYVYRPRFCPPVCPRAENSTRFLDGTLF